MSTLPKPRKLIRRTEVLAKLGNASKSSGQRHVFTRPDCPKPVKLLPGIELFDDAEIDGFIEKLLDEREAVQ